VCRRRRGFSNFKNEHVKLLNKMTYPREKRTQTCTTVGIQWMAMSAKRERKERMVVSCVILLEEITKTIQIKDFVFSRFFLFLKKR